MRVMQDRKTGRQEDREQNTPHLSADTTTHKQKMSGDDPDREAVDKEKRAHPIRTRGQHNTRHSRHSMGPPRKQKGDTTHKTGRPVTLPPFPHHATHHPLWPHPPSTTRGGAHRGYPATRTAQTHTHHPHTAAPGEDSARHDCSTLTVCTGSRGHGPHALDWAGQQQYTPPPFHIPRRMDTIHSSTPLLSLIHVHTINDQR